MNSKTARITVTWWPDAGTTRWLGSTPVRDVGKRQTTCYADDPYPSQRAAQCPCGKTRTLIQVAQEAALTECLGRVWYQRRALTAFDRTPVPKADMGVSYE